MIIQTDCKYCSATGKEPDYPSYSCYNCYGNGTVDFNVPTYEGLLSEWNESNIDETQDRFIYNELLKIIRQVLETPSIIIRD